MQDALGGIIFSLRSYASSLSAEEELGTRTEQQNS